MFSLTALSVLSLFSTVVHDIAAAPSHAIELENDLSRYGGLDANARSLLKRAVPAAPNFIIYSDDWVTGALPSLNNVEGYSVYALSFLLPNGAVDQAQNWVEELTAAQRTAAIASYHAAGISVIVSAFGSTIEPTNAGIDPSSTATTMANWVIEYGLDGIDVDYEDFDSFNNGNGDAETWLKTFTTTLRQTLPVGQYILSHAPVAPWFSPNLWSGGGYLAVHESVGNLIDWYNVQFYNQGGTNYTTCEGLLTASDPRWPDSAVFQIAASGVPLSKIVIGKPATTSDASNGYIDPGTLATCVQQAAQKGWNAGVMVWQYPNAAASWISTVRALAFPEGGSTPTIPPPTTSPTTTPPSSPTTTPPSGGGGGGNCAGVSAWQSSVAYTGGSQVTYNGDLWTAKWWSEADVPGGAAGDWTNDGPCTSAALKTPFIATAAAVPGPALVKPLAAAAAADHRATEAAAGIA